MSSSKILMPDTMARKSWNMLILAATVWYTWTIPLFLVPKIGVPSWSLWVNLALTVIFLFDILLHFRTAILDDGELITNREAIHERYLKGFFFFDLMASIPWDLLLWLMGFWEIAVWASAIRMLRIFRLPHLLRVHGTAMPATITEQLFITNFWVLTITSWCASIWMSIVEIQEGDDLTAFIIKGYYWTVTTMASVGYGDITPQTNAGRIFAMFVMLLGVAVYAFIIGHISTLIVNVNLLRKQNKEKIEQLAAFMQQYDLPSTLQNDIFSFYRHYLMEHSAGGASILKDLPNKLSDRIHQHVNIYLLRRCPLFKKASQELLEALGAKMSTEMFLPSEQIIRIGEVGNEMYILVHGVVAVTNESGELIAKLRTKDVFGEIALLQDTVRMANIKAITACNTLKLHKEDFDQVMASFPEFRKELRTIQMHRVGLESSHSKLPA
ncbi:MAG: cyclic nucleotide-binding domain-containing protein [Magnetococcales bacterium]|nr:ion transporter [Magnetococcales bacterium]NGZ07702.1 cyclic nucleotide-binding domain-containing protein [Magnetococcales bacterium]